MIFGEPPFALVGEALEEPLAHQEPRNRVAEELVGLVVAAPVVLMGEGPGMGARSSMAGEALADVYFKLAEEGLPVVRGHTR